MENTEALHEPVAALTWKGQTAMTPQQMEEEARDLMLRGHH